MKPAIALSLLALAALASGQAAGQQVSGRVQGVYFQAAPGVLVDSSMLHAPSARRWADVEVQQSGPRPAGRDLVEVPAGTTLGPGDTIAYRPGEPKSTELAETLPLIASGRELSVSPAGPQFAESASTGASKVPAR